MNSKSDQLAILFRETEKLQERHTLAETVTPDYYEPGMMEYLEQSNAVYNEESSVLTLSFEAKGTRYEGRTEAIERIKCGDKLIIVRDKENQYNPNNFSIISTKGINLGNVPAELCNAMADLYDNGVLSIKDAEVSYVEPISKRSRHAKQAVLFVRVIIDIQTGDS